MRHVRSTNFATDIIPFEYHFQIACGRHKTYIQMGCQRHERIFRCNINMVM